MRNLQTESTKLTLEVHVNLYASQGLDCYRFLQNYRLYRIRFLQNDNCIDKYEIKLVNNLPGFRSHAEKISYTVSQFHENNLCIEKYIYSVMLGSREVENPTKKNCARLVKNWEQNPLNKLVE